MPRETNVLDAAAEQIEELVFEVAREEMSLARADEWQEELVHSVVSAINRASRYRT